MIENRASLWMCLGFLLLAVGCSSGVHPEKGGHDKQEMGTLQLPLSAWAEDGYRYRLAGIFELTGPQNQTIDVKGVAPEIKLTLPVGKYLITLKKGWTLYQSSPDSSSEKAVKEAKLQVKNAQPLTIQADKSASANFRFGIGADAVAFGYGKGSIKVKVEKPKNPIQIAVGGVHTCLLTETGSLHCWGTNNVGQLGQGNTINKPSAANSYVSFNGVSTAITAGGGHTCALSTSGQVRCWGANSFGQLGYGHTKTIGDDERLTTLASLPSIGGVIAITAGTSHTCALTESGQVRCWGRNNFGQLGCGHTNNIGDDETPTVNVKLGGQALAIAAGESHTCALMQSGAVRCWGRNNDGQLGYGHTNNIGDDEHPVNAGDVELGGKATAVVTGGRHTCALLEGGRVSCWGLNNDGQLGYGHTEKIGDNEIPVKAGFLNLPSGVKSLSAGGFHNCAIVEGTSKERRLHCWGNNAYGQLGYGHTDNIGDNEDLSSLPDVPLTTRAHSVTTGLLQTCLVTQSNTLRCWGENDYYQLGYGHTNSIGDDEPVSTAGFVNFR